MRYLYKTILFLTIFINSSFAGTGGSSFSRYGLGDIQYLQTTYSMGIAGVGISILNPGNYNRINPAGLTQINNTRYVIDVYYLGSSVKDDFQKSYYSSIIFHGFDLLIPISTDNGITIGAGLLPYSRIDYNIITNVVANNLNYDLSYSGEGGLSLAYLSGSWNLIPDLHLGARFNYIFGNNNHLIKQSIITEDYTSFEMQKTTRYYGAGGTIGLIYSGFNKIIGLDDSKNISFGLVFNSGTKLYAENERFYKYFDNAGVITRDTTPAIEGTAEIPISFGLGINYMHDKRYQLAAEFFTQNWNDTKYFGTTTPELKNSYRLSIGAGILPLKDPKTEGLQKLGYRLGFFYSKTYYNIKGEDINLYGFTAGTDFPIFGITRLEIGLEYSIRGLTSLQKENMIKFSVGINGAERWFVRPEEE